MLTRRATLLRSPIRILLALLLALSFLTALPAVRASFVGLGELVSEKVLGRDGVTNSSLLLGRTGTNTELSVLGFAPAVSTLTVGATGPQTATLRGQVSNMNGMPTATGYFQWGYSAALGNATPTFVVAATGDYSSTLTGFDDSEKIYYRFVTDADGTNYGSIISFVAAPGTGSFLLKLLLRIILALAIVVGVLLLSSNSLAMLVAAIIGLIGFAVISSMLDTLL